MSMAVATVTSCWLKSLHNGRVNTHSPFAISTALLTSSLLPSSFLSKYTTTVRYSLPIDAVPSHRILHTLTSFTRPRRVYPSSSVTTSRYAYQSLKDTIVLHRASICRSRSLPKGSSLRTLSTSTSRKRNRYRQFPIELTPKPVIPLSLRASFARRRTVLAFPYLISLSWSRRGP
jgi:hypothetical protein